MYGTAPKVRQNTGEEKSSLFHCLRLDRVRDIDDSRIWVDVQDSLRNCGHVRIRDAKIGRQRDDAVQGEILLAVPEAPAFLEAPLMNITEA